MVKKNTPSKSRSKVISKKKIVPQQSVEQESDSSVPENAEVSSEDYSSDEDAQPEVTLHRTPGTIPPMTQTSHVSEKTKKKITRGEFFPMVKLLPSLEEDIDPEERMTYREWSRTENLKRSKEVVDKKLSYYQWTRCFRIYMSLRLEMAPSELQGMLRHAEIVQDLASQGKDAIAYDALFRRAKEQHPSIQWGEYLAQIINNLPPRRPQQTKPYKPFYNNRVNLPQFGQQGICARFNSPTPCTYANCRYAHKCRICLQFGHPQQRCFRKQTKTR